jgi:UDP-N-acetylglucosamine transferase subunit ALG13
VSTFVSLGNATQPFPRLLAAVAAAEALLPRPLLVQHGATPAEAMAGLQGTTCHAFLPMAAFERLVMEARLLILHAGAGSVIHAVRAGKRPVVMPRRQQPGEHVDDHQLEFARALAASGHVLLAESAEDLPQAIEKALATPIPSSTAATDNAMLRLVSETLAGYAARFPT